jgi:hypothetical protein
MGCGRFYRFVGWYDLEGRDDEAAGTARNVVPRIGVSLVALGLALHRRLVAIAVLAEDFFPWHYAIDSKPS